MTAPKGSYTIPRPPDWLLAVVAGLLAGGGGSAAGYFADGGAMAADVAVPIATHNVLPGAHPDMKADVSYLKTGAERTQQKMDLLLTNQIKICSKLEVDCSD